MSCIMFLFFFYTWFVIGRHWKLFKKTNLGEDSHSFLSQVRKFTSMAPEIVGTLPVNHFVDQNGSLSINVPLQVPHAKLMPQLSLAYHSAANSSSTVGFGWVIKGASFIERVPSTIDQDGRRGRFLFTTPLWIFWHITTGVVNYDKNDCFALDGQRLMEVGRSSTETQYRFELETWSKIVAYGDPVNPARWEEHLPNGTTRKFGDTTVSLLCLHLISLWPCPKGLQRQSTRRCGNTCMGHLWAQGPIHQLHLFYVRQWHSERLVLPC